MTSAPVDKSDTADARLKLSGRHTYTLDGHKIPGVTTIIGTLDKPALVQWAANQAASHAIDSLFRRLNTAAGDTNPDAFRVMMNDLSPTTEYEQIRMAHRNTVKKAALRGTRIHAMGEALAHGEPVEVPEEHRGAVEAYARFLDAWELETIETELSVAHSEYRYGGTFDLVASSPRICDGAPVMLDIKTGKGIYREVALQLAAYRYADYAARREETVGPRGGKKTEWVEKTMPATAAGFAIHVTDDSAVLVPVDAGENTWSTFLHVLTAYRWLDAEKHDPAIFEPVFPEQGWTA